MGRLQQQPPGLNPDHSVEGARFWGILPPGGMGGRRPPCAGGCRGVVPPQAIQSLTVTYSRDERLALAALLEETGPDTPTLCAGWQTRDLAAHLVVRERRPDADVGMLGGPLAGYTARDQQGYLGRH